jgi:hypothetical protein
MTDLVGWYFIAFDDCDETAWDGIVHLVRTDKPN